MKLYMSKVEGRDEVRVTIYAKPIQVLEIDTERNRLLVEWEGCRWWVTLPPGYSFPGERHLRDALLAKINQKLTEPDSYEELADHWPSLEDRPDGKDPFPDLPVTGE